MNPVWDQKKFNEAMADYVRVSSRTLPSIINTKAYYIARKAIWFTQKADAPRIKANLGQFITVNRIGKKGKTVKKRELVLVRSTRAGRNQAPVAALIVQARRAKEGSKGLWGPKMAKAVRDLMAARLRSVAFLKSGWLPAVKKLEPVADKKNRPPIDTTAKQVGQAKGDAKAASGSSWRPVAEILNNASARRDTKGALAKWGGAGLDRAFRDEVASMREYVERKMKPDADQFNKKAA